MTDPTARTLLAAAIRYGESCRDLHGGPPQQLHPSYEAVTRLLVAARGYAAAVERGEEA